MERERETEKIGGNYFFLEHGGDQLDEIDTSREAGEFNAGEQRQPSVHVRGQGTSGRETNPQVQAPRWRAANTRDDRSEAGEAGRGGQEEGGTETEEQQRGQQGARW